MYQICTNRKDRKKNRLPGFNYSSDGGYFVTICVKNRIPYFGTIQKGIMTLNTYGEIVLEKWKWLEKQYKYVQLGNCIVMPNHFHGIVFINNSVGTGRDPSLQKTKIKSLSELIGAFKTVSAKKINKTKQIPDFYWQRSFYDHIIRNENELHNISDYISLNPRNWEYDEFNLITLQHERNPLNHNQLSQMPSNESMGSR